MLNPVALEAIVGRCRDRTDSGLRFRFVCATNAVGLSEQKIRPWVEDPDRELIFSLDGPPAVHDRIRVGARQCGTYRRAIKWVEFYRGRYRRFGKRFVSSTVLTATSGDFGAVLTHLDRLGFESIVMRPIRGANSTELGLRASTLAVFLGRYCQLVDVVERRALAGDTRLLSKLMNRYDAFGRLVLAVLDRQKRLQGCPGCPLSCNDPSRFALVFDVDGSVYYPCRDFAGLPEYRLGRADASVDMRRMQDRMGRLCVTRRPVCRDCAIRFLCGGGCYNSSLLSTGQVERPDDNLCVITRYLSERAIGLVFNLAITRPSVLEEIVAQVTRVERADRGRTP